MMMMTAGNALLCVIHSIKLSMTIPSSMLNCLQLEPRKRILAQDALHHQYFSDLPAKIYDLPDGNCFRQI